ncbi:MAG: radical SAM protein [Candidatus Verstraetearchaeota archaeon]|nr:radical SAM protein [Candidatus Verstraetearchaeota archaeon]
MKALIEVNAVKKDWRKVETSFGLCYPSVYRVGMSCLATHIIYQAINDTEQAVCERFFLDSLLPRGSLESRFPPTRFKALGFSIQYELDYVNMLKFLVNSGIELDRAKRKDGPLIIVGGPVPSSNPLPVLPFIDAVVVGEVEEQLPQILDAIAHGETKEDQLELLAKIEGVYVPGISSKVRRIYPENLDDVFYPLRQVIPQVEDDSPLCPVLGKAFLLEVSRGCPRRCRFCLESYLYHPFRARSFETLLELAENGVALSSVRKIVCIGSAAGDLSYFTDLLEELVNKGFHTSVPALNPYAITELLLKAIQRGGQRTLTLAPETGSCSLQEVCGKRVDLSLFLEAVSTAKKVGFKHLKLYFLIGLPGETADDIATSAALLREVARRGFSGASLHVSVNPLIPKPHTPFQWLPMLPIHEYRRRFRILVSSAKLPSTLFELLDPRLAYLQAFLSLGGEEVSEPLKLAAIYGGSLRAWRKALRECSINLEELLTKPRDVESNLPWDFIDTGVPRSLLLQEYTKALSEPLS